VRSGYEIGSFPLLLYTCNCTNCQSASGSAFALNMPVLTKDFHILQGEPKGYVHDKRTALGFARGRMPNAECRMPHDRTG
jgi:hypothetical protein